MQNEIVETNKKSVTRELTPTDKIPARLVLWIMMFTCCWVSYMVRVNMSLILVAMVAPQPATLRNNTLRSQWRPKDILVRNITLRRSDFAIFRAVPLREDKDSGNTFDWSARVQGLILGSYFWSYPITSLFGGMAAERWGPRYVVLINTFLSGILTGLCPLAAKKSYLVLIVLRFFLGLAGGFTYPSLHSLVAQWVPPEEKGKFISALMGGTLGTVATWSILGPVIKRFGWEPAFYLAAVLTLAWCILWWYLIADTPSKHPRISETEKQYILDALGDKVQASKRLPPFKRIFTSIPFLAMIVLHFGNLWGMNFIMTAAPKFVSDVLGFQMSSAGAIAALPYLARLVCATIFGSIGDCMFKKKTMSTTKTRKFFCIFSHILPGLLLVLLGYACCSAALSVSLITMSTGFNGAATLTNLQNHQDLAPNYAGTLYGIANCIGSTTGFFTPMITAHFTKHGNTITEWRPIFFVGALAYILSAIFFMCLGTSDTQSWNYSYKESDRRDNTNIEHEDLNGLKINTNLHIKDGTESETKDNLLNGLKPNTDLHIKDESA